MTGRVAPEQRRAVFRARLLGTIGWLIVTPPAVSAGARLAGLDEASPLLVLADGLTPLLGPPAFVALGIGLQQRRWTLAVLSAVTAGAFLCFTVPGVGVPVRVPSPGEWSAPFRLFSANVYDANPDVGPIAKEILGAAPDLVALQELDPDGAEGLRRSGVLARFPYRVTEIRNGASGIALWSRFPLAESQVLDIGGMPAISATVVLGARRLRLYAVHVIAPVRDDGARWKAQLRRIDEEIRRERRPLVVVGDFNATRYHPSFRRLLSDQLADAHERRGRGWATTWPRNRWPLPPLMRLDHVLVSPEVHVRSVREGVGRGSDHRPIITDLILP